MCVLNLGSQQLRVEKVQLRKAKQVTNPAAEGLLNMELVGSHQMHDKAPSLSTSRLSLFLGSSCHWVDRHSKAEMPKQSNSRVSVR